MIDEKYRLISEILDGKSKQRLRESYFKKNFLTIYDNIINYTDINLKELPFVQKMWHWVNDNPNIFLCKTCNEKPTTFNKNWEDGYRSYCSQKCSAVSESTKLKRVNTCLETYGETNVAKVKEIYNKVVETNILKYGFKCSFQNTEVREKWKLSIMAKYGVEHVFQLPKIIEQISIKRRKFLNTFFEGKELFTTDYFKDKSNETRRTTIYEKYKNIFHEKCNDEYDFIDYKNSIFKINHKKCNTITELSLGFLIDRNHANNSICTACYPIHENKSIGEKEVINWIKDMGIKLEESNNIIIKPKHLDIYIPSMNLAIEYNGLYHHNDSHKNIDYHYNKSLGCEKQGIHLIHIWSDEWRDKRDIIKSIILNKMNMIKQKIYARKCELKIVSDINLIRNFLNENHIQGYTNSTTKLGLYYNNELISLMIFGYSRNGLELLRFCNKINLNVIGGASKLFSYYVKNYDFEYINSFSDYRLFDGSVYIKLGFNKLYLTSPDYYWCTDHERKHKSNFTHKKLIKQGYDANKSEDIIMRERGYNKIYNSGLVKWVYKKLN